MQILEYDTFENAVKKINMNVNVKAALHYSL